MERSEMHSKKVKVDDGYLVESSKAIPKSEAIGEWTGIAKFTNIGWKKYFAEIEQLLAEGDLNVYNTKAMNRLASKFKQIWLTRWHMFRIHSPTNPSDDGWRGLYQWFDRDEIKDSLSILDQFEDTDSEKVFYSIYGMFLDNLFTKYATKQDKKYWAEKTPANSVYAPFLAQCFDNLKLINVIRDGRDVACSLLKVPWGPDEPKEALDWWAFHLTKALKAQKKLPQNSFLNVRYEDIVLKTEPTLHRIIDFLGVDWDDNLLSFEIYKGSVGRYQKDLAPEAQQYAQDKYGNLLSMLGYSEKDKEEVKVLC